MKWGEYSNDVQFILQRSDQQKTVANHANGEHSTKNPASSPPQANESPKKAKQTIDQSKGMEKSFSLSSEPEANNIQHANENIVKTVADIRKSELIGIVKGKKSKKKRKI